MGIPAALIIIPTYNEADNIRPLLDALLNVDSAFDILVVDDNSPDGTHRIVSNYARHESRIHLLLRQQKEGLAKAYLAGFEWGIQRGYEQLVEMDADFSHDPNDVPRLLKQFDSHDVIVGCRYSQGGKVSGWSWMRQFISRGGNFYAKFILQLPFQDLTGGFNGWKKEVLEKIQYQTIRSKGYAFQVELKYRAYTHGFKLLEIPIHFRNREKGYSKMTGSIVWEAAFRVLEMKRSFGCR